MEYRIYKNSHYEATGFICPRDNEMIYREILNNGHKTDHICCKRDGCTWTDYYKLDNDITSSKKYPIEQ